MSQAVAVSHGEFGRAALYRLNRPIITHAHREGHLIFHIDGDPAPMTVAGETVLGTPSRCVAVSPWEPHSFDCRDGRESLHLVLYIKPMWFLENSRSAEYALNFGAAHVRLTPGIVDLVKRLTAHLLDDENGAHFDSLLFALTRECFERSWRSSGLTQLRKSCQRFNDFRVRRSLRLMQDHVCEDVEMESLARAVGLSRPHFFKLFKQQMKVTPNIYLNTLRSEHAIDDLLTTEKTVTEIALDLGFSSQASFTRFFSSNVGIAPSEYRRVAHTSGSAFPMMG